MKRKDKTENILLAAERRFAHFGVSKTTMNEIAKDAGISKASIYYYYPDKLNLYAAVLSRTIDRERTKENFVPAPDDLLIGLLNYLDKRTDFIIRNYRILEHLNNISGHIPRELHALFESANQHDVEVIRAFLKKGNECGILKMDDVEQTAGLLHDCLSGLRYSLLNVKIPAFPEKKRFNELLEREKTLVAIFFRAFSQPG